MLVPVFDYDQLTWTEMTLHLCFTLISKAGLDKRMKL